jgi:predicted nucleic acid-binding protein
MNAAFIDTSFLFALASPTDALHHRAVLWRYAVSGPFVTTEFVLLEVADGFARKQLRHWAVTIIDSIRKSPSTTILPVDADSLARGYALYRQHRDKDWGLTDCISFEVMHERHISDALTHDRHFEQAGFRALLRSDPPSN